MDRVRAWMMIWSGTAVFLGLFVGVPIPPGTKVMELAFAGRPAYPLCGALSPP